MAVGNRVSKMRHPCRRAFRPELLPLATNTGCAMRTNTTPAILPTHAYDVFRGLIIAMLAFPFAACAETPLAKPVHVPLEDADCFAASTLPEKRACLAEQSDVFIDKCERMRPISCKPYREMHFAEKALQEAEADLMKSAQQAYGSYINDDPAYLDDLAAHSREANTAWRAYRDAQCALEPLAQGMARSESENLAETCRLDRTKTRIAELEALKASTGAIEELHFAHAEYRQCLQPLRTLPIQRKTIGPEGPPTKRYQQHRKSLSCRTRAQPVEERAVAFRRRAFRPELFPSNRRNPSKARG